MFQTKLDMEILRIGRRDEDYDDDGVIGIWFKVVHASTFLFTPPHTMVQSMGVPFLQRMTALMRDFIDENTAYDCSSRMLSDVLRVFDADGFLQLRQKLPACSGIGHTRPYKDVSTHWRWNFVLTSSIIAMGPTTTTTLMLMKKKKKMQKKKRKRKKMMLMISMSRRRSGKKKKKKIVCWPGRPPNP